MKKTLAAILSVSFVVLLAGPGLACLMPEAQSMGPMGDSSSCCAIHCQFQTTPEGAKQYCDQTQRGVGKASNVSNPPQGDIRFLFPPPGWGGSYAFLDPVPSGPPCFIDFALTSKDSPPKVDRYLLCRTLLI